LNEGDLAVPPYAPLEFTTPRVRHSRSTNRFATTSTGLNLRYRTSSQTNAWVETNLPVVTAFDQRTNQNIVVWVDTKHVSRTNGEIYVHPGFRSTDILNVGSKLSPTNTSPPTETHPAGYTWDMETDNIVGVACGDVYYAETYNCLLAWQDRGMPWGRVLYTFFRVDTNNQIEWMGTSYVLSDSRTSSGVQAAYMKGFQMVWKGWLGDGNIVERRLTSTTSSLQYTRSEELVVDSPTYLYVLRDWYPVPTKNF
jgi:hypothetical protein